MQIHHYVDQLIPVYLPFRLHTVGISQRMKQGATTVVFKTVGDAFYAVFTTCAGYALHPPSIARLSVFARQVAEE